MRINTSTNQVAGTSHNTKSTQMLLTHSKKQHTYGQMKSIACQYSQLRGDNAHPKKYTKYNLKSKYGVVNVKG